MYHSMWEVGGGCMVGYGWVMGGWWVGGWMVRYGWVGWVMGVWLGRGGW